MSNCPVETAAKFAANYPKKYLNAPRILVFNSDRKLQEKSEKLANRLAKIRKTNEVFLIKSSDKWEFAYLNIFLKDICEKKVGECEEFCLVAAFALKKFGYLHDIDMMGVIGKNCNEKSPDHTILRIHGKKEDERQCADPYANKLSKDQLEQLGLSEGEFKAFGPISNFKNHVIAFLQLNNIVKLIKK